jgi:DNA-binding response OmpR family regulator
LIVDDRRDVLELNRILLTAEGYETEGCTYEEATPERFRTTKPRVVLLDLVPRDDAPWALLERLRQDEATRDIGVVVTSDAPALVERALTDARLGVVAGLVMPFDIEALYAAITTAERDGRKVAPAAPVSLLERTAEALRQGRGRVLVRWVQRLSTLDAFRRRPDLSLEELQGRGGDLIDGVAEALALLAATRAVPAAVAGVPLDAAREHARLRRAQGLTATDLVRETVALRREIWREVRGAFKAETPPADEVWRLQGRVLLALDEELFAMLDALNEA